MTPEHYIMHVSNYRMPPVIEAQVLCIKWQHNHAVLLSFCRHAKNNIGLNVNRMFL